MSTYAQAAPLGALDAGAYTGATLEQIMESEQLQVGQRIRVHLPGAGDHGQQGTIKKVQDGKYYVHLDWDQRPQRVVVFYARDLERIPDEAHDLAPSDVGT